MANYYKNVSLKKADNGGYIVCFDKYCESPDAYDGMRYMNEGKEVFETGEDALARFDELHNSAIEMEKKMEKKSAAKSKGSVEVKIKAAEGKGKIS